MLFIYTRWTDDLVFLNRRKYRWLFLQLCCSVLVGWFFFTFSDLNTNFGVPQKDKSQIHHPGQFWWRQDVLLSLQEALTLPPLVNSEKCPLLPKKWNQIATDVVVWWYAKFITGEEIKCLGVFSLAKWSFVCWMLAVNLAWLNTQE